MKSNTAKKIKKGQRTEFPKEVFVARVVDGDATWLTTHETADDAVSDDEPDVVLGVYRLVRKIRAERVVVQIDEV